MTKLIDQAVTAWALAGGLLLIAITAVTSLNVGALILNRVALLFGESVSGLPGYEDFVRLTISCAALMFFPYCQMQRGHVVVSLFVSGLPVSVRRNLTRFWLALTAIAALFLAGWMTVGMAETRADQAMSSILGWTLWPFYLPGIVSLALWALVAARQSVLDPGEV